MRPPAIFLFCAVFLSVLSIQAQEEVDLKGKILADSLDTYEVNIKNLRTNRVSISKPDREFSVRVKSGDAILFYSLNFSSFLLEINDSIIKEGYALIQLERALHDLEEVHLQTGLTGDLEEDIIDLPIFDQSKFGFIKTFIPYTPGERREKEGNDLDFKFESGPKIRFEPLVNRISGRSKFLKRQLNNEREEEGRKWISDVFRKEFFIEDL